MQPPIDDIEAFWAPHEKAMVEQALAWLQSALQAVRQLGHDAL